MTSSERAEQIRDKALKAVADRITELGNEFHPAAIPIVAANVAMHVMADELLDDMRVPDALVVGHIARLTAWGPGERQAEPAVTPASALEGIEHLYPNRDVWCPTCGWTSPRSWSESIDEDDECYVECDGCGYVNGPLDGPLDSRVKR